MMMIANGRELGEQDIESIAIGAWILGTGGGGSTYPGLLNLRRLYQEGKTARLVSPADLPDDAKVGVLFSMGAPLVGQERLISSASVEKAARTLEAHLGYHFDALMPLEIGGGNALFALMGAAELGYPLVDADAMGRAYPRLEMTSFAIGGLRPYPLAIADVRDNEVVVARASSWQWAERTSREVCVAFGSMSSVCHGPRTGKEVREWGIPKTVSKSISIGQTVRMAKASHRDPVEALIEKEDAILLTRGKVSDVSRTTHGGFLTGNLDIACADGPARISFQNEWSAIWLDGRLVSTTPDLISVIDEQTGEAIGTDTIRFGQRIAVIALRPPDILRSDRGIDLVGPKAFGLDVPVCSVFADV